MSQTKIIAKLPYLLEQLFLKLKDYALLMKMRLLFLVVFSSLMTYFIVALPEIVMLDVVMLFLGGIAVTGSANALNQVLEKDYDVLMNRTMNRPLPAKRMTVSEAVIVAGVLAVVGTFLLATINPIVSIIGALSLFSYAFVYTPLKRVSSFAVFIGAFPGALPIVIGGMSCLNYNLWEVMLLFGIQFFWQFPHFWAIAWNSDAEYKKAGFNLLPSIDSEKNPTVGKLSFIYSLMLFPLVLGLYFYMNLSVLVLIILIGLCCFYSFYSFQFWKKSNDASARSLMFSSFVFLPFFLMTVLIDQIIFVG